MQYRHHTQCVHHYTRKKTEHADRFGIWKHKGWSEGLPSMKGAKPVCRPYYHLGMKWQELLSDP